MRYFDTSFMVPLFLRESTSSVIETYFASLLREERSISHWTRVEFSSLLALKIRLGQLDIPAARSAEKRFEVTVANSFTVFLPSAADFDLAKEYLGNFSTGLRGGDALHLAIAANQNAETIHSLDKRLIKAGTMLNLPMTSGITPGT